MEDDHVGNEISDDDKNNLSDIAGHSPTLRDTAGHSRTLSPEEHWLTTNEFVLRLATEFQVKRDLKSAQRYCKAGKVNAFFDDAQGIWFTERGSIDLLGAQLKGIQDRREGERVVIEPPKNVPQPQNKSESENRTETGKVDDRDSEEGVYELRAQVLQLEYEVKAKAEIVNHLQAAREKDRDKFIELASESGEYKSEVRQLKAMLQLGDGNTRSTSVTTVADVVEPVSDAKPKQHDANANEQNADF